MREDQELRIFFTNLVSNFLYTEGEFARIDILNCSVGQSPEGMMMLQALSDLVQVPVFAAQVLGRTNVCKYSTNNIIELQYSKFSCVKKCAIFHLFALEENSTYVPFTVLKEKL